MNAAGVGKIATEWEWDCVDYRTEYALRIR